MSTTDEHFPDEVPQKFGDDTGKVQFETEPLPPEMLFKFGKQVLAVVALMLVAVSATRIALNGNDSAKQVWDYATVFLNSVASLVLGYYFGKRDK
ncbi:MAG: hypothetical protein LH606_04045 [Cytophagaceae bacterium]|nr:hypothetical protein [Cytophagaceae bacterium]